MSSGNGVITLGDAIIYLRMSDFRDADGMTFAERADQLRTFAIGLGVPAGRIRVAIENDAGNDGGYRPASAYKRPVRVTTATGLVTMRTRRPVFARALLDLQTGKAGVLICDDVSRIARDERDALDLIDACELGKASAFSPSEDSADGIGSLRITRGGTREEIRSFREWARAAHDYSADISDKVQRGRKRWAGKSYWGGRRPYGRMIDPVAGYYQQAAQLVTDTGDNPAGALYLTQADPLMILRDLLGHTSVTTTEICLSRLDTTRVFREAYESAGRSSHLTDAVLDEVEAEFDDDLAGPEAWA